MRIHAVWSGLARESRNERFGSKKCKKRHGTHDGEDVANSEIRNPSYPKRTQRESALRGRSHQNRMHRVAEQALGGQG